MTGQSQRLKQVPYGSSKLKLQKKRLFHLKSISSYVFWDKYLKLLENDPWYT